MPDSVDQILTRLSPGKFDAERAANFDIERAKGALESNVPIERILNFDDTARTIEFSFATDQPIEHWFGNVVLSTKKSDVILDRVNNGVCPLLVNHDRNQHCGVVIENSINLGPSIRGIAKFSRSQLGEDMFNDVKDEIRNGTSLGFLIHDLVLISDKKDSIPTYRANKWEMLENSIASIPADINCGAGRSFEKQVSDAQTRAISTNGENTMTPEEIAAQEAAATRTAAPAPVVDTRTPEQETAHRASAIMDFAAIFADRGGPEIARNMLAASPDVTLDDVRTAIKDAKPTSVVVPPGETPEQRAKRENPGMQTGIELAHSLPRFGTLRNFTGENGVERAYRFGQWFLACRGVKSAMEFCEKNGITRAMSEGVNESGGFLVPEEFGNDLIDLREIYGVARRSFKMVPMASDTRSDPRRDGGLTAYFEGEGDLITTSDASWGRVSLTAKKLAVLARYSNEVNEDALINMGDTLAGEIAYAFALKEDQCAFIGDGSSTYGGMQGVCTKIKGLSGTIANIAGLVVGTGNAYSELILTDFEGVAAKLPVYADTPRAKWYCHKSVYWNVMVKLALAAGGSTGAEATQGVAKRFLGYDVEFVQVMPSVEANSQVCALLGDLSLGASFGSRRDTTIAISEHSRFANDQLEIRGTERFDINVHDVGNASATAGLRVPGPIVGLITAAS